MNDLTATTVIAICTVIALVLSCAGVCTKLFMSKLTDVIEVTERAITALGQTVEREVKALEHKVNDHAGLIKSLELKSDDKESRLLRVEMAVENFKDGQERLREEVKDTRLHIEAKMDKKFDQLDASIRESRDVKRS